MQVVTFPYIGTQKWALNDFTLFEPKCQTITDLSGNPEGSCTPQTLTLTLYLWSSPTSWVSKLYLSLIIASTAKDRVSTSKLSMLALIDPFFTDIFLIFWPPWSLCSNSSRIWNKFNILLDRKKKKEAFGILGIIYAIIAIGDAVFWPILYQTL